MERKSQQDQIQNALPKHNELETEYTNINSIREKLWEESQSE